MAGWFTNAIAGAMQILVQEEGDDLFEQRRADERMQRLDSSGPESPRSPSLFADEVEPQLPVAIAEASAPLTGETHTLDHEYDATLQVAFPQTQADQFDDIPLASAPSSPQLAATSDDSLHPAPAPVHVDADTSNAYSISSQQLFQNTIVPLDDSVADGWETTSLRLSPVMSPIQSPPQATPTRTSPAAAAPLVQQLTSTVGDVPAATALPDTSPEECHELCAHVELATPAEIVLHPESSLADIAEDRDCSESVVASLQAQVLSLQAERDDLADTLSKMKSSWTPTSALQDAQKRIASLEQAAVQHHAQLEKAAAESRERVASEAKLSAALSALQRKYADAVADVPLAAAAKAALESQLAELRSANSALHHSLEHAQSKLSSTSEREHELAQQTAAYRALQESFTKLQRSFDKMQSDFRVSVGRESEIERQLEQARSGRDDKLAELQTNVAQLREALNTLSTSEDAMRKQRDSTAAENTKLKSQLAVLHEELSFVAQRNETLGHEVDVLSAKATAAANDARDAKQELLRQATVWEAREVHLVSRLAEFDSQAQAASSLQAEVATVKADLRTRNQDVDRLARSLANLQQVLDQFQSDRDQEVARCEAMITSLQSRAAAAEAALDAKYAQGRADEHAALVTVIDTAAQVPRLQTELARTRQVLQEQLQRAASFSDSEMLDRRVIRKLMVTYFQKPKAANEVLKLIASMLGFNDDDKIAVGLLQRPTLTSMLFGSPSPASGEASLTDAWVQFLMEESTSPPSGSTPAKARIASAAQTTPTDSLTTSALLGLVPPNESDSK